MVLRPPLTVPIEGTVGVIAEPDLLGGTRHLSAAQLEHDQRDAIAMVASQDGRFTVFGWSVSENGLRKSYRDTAVLRIGI